MLRTALMKEKETNEDRLKSLEGPYGKSVIYRVVNGNTTVALQTARALYAKIMTQNASAKKSVLYYKRKAEYHYL